MSRIDKINEQIKREISHMILFGEISDPRLKFVTILKADVSKDLQHARVRFSTLSDDPVDIKDATEGLDSCRGYMRKLLSQRLETRYTPQIQFIYDKGLQHLARVESTLEEIKKLKTEGNNETH